MESPSLLIDWAEQRLLAAEEALLEAAARWDPTVRDPEGARQAVVRVFGDRLAESEDPLVRYREAVDRARHFAESHGLYGFPAEYREDIRPLPAHRLGQTASTNWPPIGGDPRPLLLVSPRPSDHARANLDTLAVHEGTPGHGLQAAWAAVALPRRDPRRLGTFDEVAMALGQFGPMLAIEGWAARAEEVLFEAGFFDDAAGLVEAVSQVIRAVRVIADLRVHLGEWDLARAAAHFSEKTGLSRGWGLGQAARLARVPLQASTYGLGVREIAKLEARVRALEGPAFHLADFHGRLARFGPVPPAFIPIESLAKPRGGDEGPALGG